MKLEIEVTSEIEDYFRCSRKHQDRASYDVNKGELQLLEIYEKAKEAEKPKLPKPLTPGKVYEHSFQGVYRALHDFNHIVEEIIIYLEAKENENRNRNHTGN